MTWGFDQQEAARITQPIKYVTGISGHDSSYSQWKAWITGIEHEVIPEVTDTEAGSTRCG